jgi:hypothetical protein
MSEAKIAERWKSVYTNAVMDGQDATDVLLAKAIEELSRAEDQVRQQDVLLAEIRDVINLLPSITGSSPVRDNAGIIFAIRDLQASYRDAAKARNFGASFTDTVKGLQEQVHQLREALDSATNCLGWITTIVRFAPENRHAVEVIIGLSRAALAATEPKKENTDV